MYQQGLELGEDTREAGSEGMTTEVAELHFGDRVQIITEATFWGTMVHGNNIMVQMDNGHELVVPKSKVKKMSEWGFLDDVDPLDDEDSELGYDATDEGGID